MRKSLLITVLGLCMSLFAQSSATYDSRSGDVIIVDDIGKKVVLESFIATEDVFDEAALRFVVSRLTKLPTNILTQLYEGGVKIVISENKFTGYAGLYVRSEKKIVIIASQETSRFLVSLHEIGHAVDHINGIISREEFFINLYDSEGERLFPRGNRNNEHSLKNESEYFAQSFAEYFSGGKRQEKMKLVAPQTFNYFESIERGGYQTAKASNGMGEIGVIVGIIVVLEAIFLLALSGS